MKFQPKFFLAFVFFSNISVTIFADNAGAGFYDDFSSGIDEGRWEKVNKQWGGNNGGVVPANVVWQQSRDHALDLVGHGDLYQGSAIGANNMMTRVGASIATRDEYASGNFTICAKLPTVLGAVSAFWLYDYAELSKGDVGYIPGQSPIRNTEIDWETPTNQGPNTPISYRYVATSAWGGQKPGLDHYFHAVVDVTPYNGGVSPADDHQFHQYEIIWQPDRMLNGQRLPGSVTWLYAEHCGEKGTVIQQIKGSASGFDDVPLHPMHLWLGLWFPVSATPYLGQYTGWAGTPDFATTAFEIKWVRVQPL